MNKKRKTSESGRGGPSGVRKEFHEEVPFKNPEEMWEWPGERGEVGMGRNHFWQWMGLHIGLHGAVKGGCEGLQDSACVSGQGV